MTEKLQQKLDTVRFNLNKWETQPQWEVKASMSGADDETGEIITNIVIVTDKPIFLGPGMKIVVVPA